MRALAILYCYPPLLVPAAMCYLKLMAGLAKSGVETEIVTISPDSFRSPGGPVVLDDSLIAVAPDLTNHVIQSPETSLWVKALRQLDPSRRFTHRWFEPKKREWTFPALRYLTRRDLTHYDVLLTCSQPHANHLLGLELKKRTGLPWIAYFSDPWTDSPYQTFTSDRMRDYHRMLEDRVHGAADAVLFTCEEMRRLVVGNHAALDDDRSGVLPHAFIPDWYEIERGSEDSGHPSRVRLLQTGSFYGPRTPVPLLEALQRVSRQFPLEGALRIDTYGGMDPKYERMIKDMGLGGILGAHGFVPYLQTLSMMKSHDAMLLIDAPLTQTAESVFLPSKLIDYLGSYSPVIAVTPERGATARVVKETGGIVCPIETPQALDEYLIEVAKGGKIPCTPRREAIGEYEHGSVGRSLASMMERLVD